MGVSWYEYRAQADAAYFVTVMLEDGQYSTPINAAVVGYSNEATMVFNFTQRFDYSLLVKGRDEFYLQDKSDRRQRIDKALTFTSKYVFATTAQDIPKIAILFAFTEHL